MDSNPDTTKVSDLSLEQQFSIKSFEAQARQMSREQAQDFLIEMYKQMLVREQVYKNLVAHQWGFSQ